MGTTVGARQKAASPFGLCRRFSECRGYTMHSCSCKAPVCERDTRSQGLSRFKHRVVRFEMQLRSLYPALYERLLALMRMVDNKAGVTLVAMLSPSCDYVGGNSCFRRGTGTEGHRQARLEQGDAVMFRGEKLLHWVTNITSGRRVILQIELSRV